MPEKRDAISERYRNEAAKLARRYMDILFERQQLEDAMEGRIIYTEEMAIADLLRSGQQEGECVQTSNISNIPEKIAILLADGYVEKQINRMRKEALRRIDDYMDLCLKVNAVEVAMGEPQRICLLSQTFLQRTGREWAYTCTKKKECIC